MRRLRACIGRAPRTRFAPGPTGYLHLGHVVNAVYVWGVARRLGGTIVLRIEDHDGERSRPEYERAILDDLDWLGLHADEGTLAELRGGVSMFRQSDRVALYQRAAAQLASAGLTYWCDCSRSDIALVSEPGEGGERPYPGTCRLRGLAAAPGRALRLIMPDTIEQFEDALLGQVEHEPHAQCGDLALRDRLGNWTYQFAVVVDDLEQDIDLIIRGEDLLPSTGRQMVMRRLLGGGPPPCFAHHPLLYAADGAKLSKRDQSQGIRELREQGCSAADVLGRAAWHVGLLDEERPVRPGALSELFAAA
jgi:glutamyl/glutaminyl-tRNA synthetase